LTGKEKDTALLKMVPLQLLPWYLPLCFGTEQTEQHWRLKHLVYMSSISRQDTCHDLSPRSSPSTLSTTWADQLFQL